MERKLINSGLLKRYNRYKKLVDKLLDEFDNYNAEQRNFKISENSWSIAHVYQHLIQVENFCEKAISSRIAGGVYNTSRIKHLWRYFLLTSALKIPRKFKVPNSAPPAIHAYDADESVIALDWKNVSSRFEAFISEIPSNLENKLVYKHPIAGPLKVAHALGFLSAHLKHHLKQLKRIRKHPGFPNEKAANQN